MTVTYSVRVSGGGIDSFLGFEYGEVITLASRVFCLLLPILPTSLRFLHIFGFVGVAWCSGPSFFAYPHDFLSCGLFLGLLCFLAFVRAAVALASIAEAFTAPILLLALCNAAFVAFFPEFCDFRASLGSS